MFSCFISFPLEACRAAEHISVLSPNCKAELSHSLSLLFSNPTRLKRLAGFLGSYNVAMERLDFRMQMLGPPTEQPSETLSPQRLGVYGVKV